MTSAFDDAQKRKTSKGALQQGTSSQSGAGKLARTFEILLQGAIALGIFMRFAWAQKRELWYDEVLSVLLSSGQKNAYRLPENVPIKVQDISQLLSIPTDKNVLVAAKDVVKGTLGDPHPPLFYLAQHTWMRWFGNSEGALRCLMVLISVAALWAAYQVGKRTLGYRGALIFTALLSLNPFFLSHSLNLRMYTPMVLWVLISAGSLLALVDLLNKKQTNNDENGTAYQRKQAWLLRIGLAGSLTAGLLTHYLFTYWLFALAALALHWDRKRWVQHGLTIGAGVALFLPWVLWGTRQQIHNRRDVLNQISTEGGSLQAIFQHGQDLAQTLANHLLLGHLTTSMTPIGEPIKPTAVAVGCGIIGLLAVCVVSLYRRRQYRILMTGLLMGVLPLMVALAIDTAANKYTLGFGWGRSVMVALPGCVLLLAAWLELCGERWRSVMVALVLVVYLSVNLADFGVGNLGGRDRQMFHAVSDRRSMPSNAIPENTLIALDTKAWGYVLRVAYYLNNAPNTELLATDPADMPAALTAALKSKNYDQVLWLQAEYPLWAQPDTPQAAEALASQTEAALRANYLTQPGSSTAKPQILRGTMNLDRLVLHEYRQALPLQ
ncbi:MAG: glycosyltransferase family 39 protein [Phormidesmis sp.]